MKKLFIYFIIIIVGLFGCAPNGNDIIESELPSEPTISFDNSLPGKIVDVDTLNVFYLAYAAAKYNKLSDWQEYIYEKLGINILVNYNAFYASTVLERVFDGVIYLNYQKGFPYEFNTTVYEYYNEEIAYELSTYYEKYGWDQYISPEYLDALTINGKIYAVPTAANKYIVPRYYNKEILDKLDIGVPQSINEFHDYLIRAKDLYKDDVNYYPSVILHHRFASSISDIARAYGIYFNNYFNISISFNPQTDSIEDAIFSDDINELLQFIRHLQKNGLMATYSPSNMVNPLNGETMDTYITKLDKLNKNFATEYHFVYSNITDGFDRYIYANKNYESLNGYYLIGNNDKYVCEIRSDMGFYVFPKGIDNIDGVIKAFDTHFTNSDNYMDFKYGIMGEDYEIINDKIIKADLDPSTDGANLELKLITDFYKLDSSNVPESLSIIESLDSNLAYERNVFNHMNTYSPFSLGNIFSFNRNIELEAIFNPNIALDDAIEHYKNLARKSGQIETIYELNKQLGKTTKFDY